MAGQVPGVDSATAYSTIQNGGYVVGSDGYIYRKIIGQNDFQAFGKAPTGTTAGAYGADGKSLTTTPTTGSGTSSTPKTTTTTKTNKTGTFDAQQYAADIVKDPSKALTPATTLSDNVAQTQADPNAAGTNIDPNQPKYQMDPNALQQTAATASPVAPKQPQTYEAQQTQGAVAQQDMTAAQGQVSQQAQVDPNAGQIDVNSIASGYNPDGTLNATGQALQEFASMDLDNVDPRATSKGQLAILQADFTGPNGEPKIPVYAQGAARAVSRIAAFRGMTGTAATAAMATAMMESTIQVANADAQFYQTLTLQNLTNKQASIIQRAGILGNMELQNADNRMAAAIQNAQAFLQMDLTNLNNEQQARVINNQNRVQSILEDAKAVNTQRLFTAQSENEMGMFYDNLNTQIQQFNANQTNDMSQFNANLENSREQFYKEMQYNIDVANAKWRQDITLHNSEQKFNAAALDVKNAVDLTTEALNQLWDRSDALLDYAFKGSESAKDRAMQLAIANLGAQTQEKIAKMQADAADSAGWGELFGTIAGNITGSDKFLDWLGF